jgi:hypothetical protein
MRNFVLAAIALLVIAPAATAAATPSTSWQKATAQSVTGGVTGKKTFVLQAYITLPMSCDAARIRTLSMNSQLHRSYIVEQKWSGTLCHSGKPNYNCTIESPTFQLPIQQPIEVDTQGKTWEVHLSMHPPTPIQPMCNKG